MVIAKGIKRIILLFVFSVFFLVSGCVPVPEEVKNEVGLYQQVNMNDIDISKLTYASLEEIKVECDSMQGTIYNQIKLPEYIGLPSQEMYLLQMNQFIDYYERQEDLKEIFFPEYDQIPEERKLKEDWLTLYNQKAIEYETWNSIPEAKEAGTWNRTLTLDYKGYIFYAKNWDTDVYTDTGAKRVLALNLDFEELPDESYILKGESVSIKEAVAFAEKTINEKMQAINGNLYQYKVQWVYVISNSMEDNYISLVLKKIYKGAEFDTTSTYAMETEELAAEQQYLYAGHQVVVEMMQKDEIGMFREEFSMKPIETESVDSYMALSSALDVVSDKLSSKSIFSFDEVKLCYTYRQENPMNLETGERK